MKLNEKFEQGTKIRNKYVEIFKNPTAKEYKEIIGPGGDECRAFLVGSDVYMWNTYGALHGEIRELLKLSKKALPVQVFTRKLSDKDVGLMVTDDSKRSDWDHNPSTFHYIQNKSYFSNKEVDVSYYDDAIVGDWSELKEEEKMSKAKELIEKITEACATDKTKEKKEE